MRHDLEQFGSASAMAGIRGPPGQRRVGEMGEHVAQRVMVVAGFPAAAPPRRDVVGDPLVGGRPTTSGVLDEATMVGPDPFVADEKTGQLGQGLLDAISADP
jgi:hypothetical protein